MNKVSRRNAIKAFAGAGIALAASPMLLSVAAANPEVSSTSGTTSYRPQQEQPFQASSKSALKGSVILHLKDGKLVGYRGAQSFVLSDDEELVSRIYQKFGE